MTETNTNPNECRKFPSVDEVKPDEEGGPIARSGFSYQDDVSVSFLIEMLETPALLKVHCETHDDILLVRKPDGVLTPLAEFVQVKANEPDKLWSVADLCSHQKGSNTSIFERSLARDKHLEDSRFRVVTLRPVVSQLKVLTLPFGAPGREVNGGSFNDLKIEINKRFPSLQSPKGNGSDYWLANCIWDVRHSSTAVRDNNLVRIMKLSQIEGKPLLPEFGEVILEHLYSLVKEASELKWEPDRDKKIITRIKLREWWELRLSGMIQDAVSPSGGKLQQKMKEAGLPDEMINLAIDLRREYAAIIRTPRFMEVEQVQRLQNRVKSEAMSLRARFVAGQLQVDGVGFHSICLDTMDKINAARPSGTEDYSAFLKGCLYDITDRCLLRFARTTP